jgi:WD40 repeat protein
MLGENSCTSPDTGAVAWSPDGRRLAVVIGTRIAVVNADGTGWHFITGGDAFSREPAWSPDGRRIAYIRLSQPGATKSALVSVNSSDGGGLRHLTAAVGIDDVAWSSRNQVAYVQGQHIFSTDSAGRHRRRLATNLDPRYIDWGPDGKRLLFSGENTRVAPGADGRYGTWSVTRDGKHQKFQAPELINSVWSPTGRRIASSGDDTFKLSRLNGSGLKIVTPDYPAAWGRAKLQAWQSVAP